MQNLSVVILRSLTSRWTLPLALGRRGADFSDKGLITATTFKASAPWFQLRVLCHLSGFSWRSVRRFRQENGERCSPMNRIRAAQHSNPALVFLDDALRHP